MRLLLLIAAAWLAAAVASGQTADLFGQQAAISDAQIAPDGRHVALGCAPFGKPTVCIYQLDGEAKPKVFNAAPEQRVIGFYWASDKHVIVNVNFFERRPTSDGVQEYGIDRALAYDVESGNVVILMRRALNYISTTYVNSICEARPDKVMMELGPSLYEVSLENGRMKLAETYRGSAAVYAYVLDNACDPIARVLFDAPNEIFAVQLTERKRKIFEARDVTKPPF